MISMILAMALACQDDAAAAAAVDTFNKTFAKEKAAEARVAAVNDLAKVLHEKVSQRLAALLTVDDKAVRIAAATGLGTFITTPELKRSAAKGLTSALTAGANSNDPDVKIAIFGALGALNEESSVNKVKDHYEDKDVKVAQAAVTASGQIKSKNLVEPLISLLRDIENELKKGQSPLPPPVGSKAPKKPAPPPPAASDADRQKRDRALAMQGTTQSALCNLTGQGSLKTADEFEKWWNKNKSNFPPK